MTRARWFKVALIALVASVASSVTSARTPPVVKLASRPSTVIREISRTRQPVLRVKAGQVVQIDTVNQLRGTEDPVAFFGAAGVPAGDVLQDAIDIGKVPRPPTGGHILTGPIYVEGAEPGDLLEVRILKVWPRVPYGVNSPNHDADGLAPHLVPVRTLDTIKLDLRRNVALVAPGLEVALAPFMGVMAVAPSADLGASVPTGAPGPFGGNMDFNRLTTGATLYLPVFASGALFYAGDGHAVQGDGEADGTAIETSLSATLQFIIHKNAGRQLRYPIAEDKDHYYILGMDENLERALRSAVSETARFLIRQAKLTPKDSYIVSSSGVDFGIAEAVDGIMVAYGAIPKRAFKRAITAY